MKKLSLIAIATVIAGAANAAAPQVYVRADMSAGRALTYSDQFDAVPSVGVGVNVGGFVVEVPVVSGEGAWQPWFGFAFDMGDIAVIPMVTYQYDHGGALGLGVDAVYSLTENFGIGAGVRTMMTEWDSFDAVNLSVGVRVTF